MGCLIIRLNRTKTVKNRTVLHSSVIHDRDYGYIQGMHQWFDQSVA